MEKDMTSFWKGIKNNYNSKVPLAPMINPITKTYLIVLRVLS